MRSEEKRQVLKFLNDVQSSFARRMFVAWEEGNLNVFWEMLDAFRAISEVVGILEN